MEKEDIVRLRGIVFKQETYSIEEAKEQVKEMADGTAIASAFKAGRLTGYKVRRQLKPAEMFKLMYICLEMTHDPSLQTDPERVTWMIAQLEKEYL